MMIEDENLVDFIETWQEDKGEVKKSFLFLKQLLESLDSVVLEFVPRQGVTYSLRARHEAQTEKPLFVMVDVIEGDPRCLSICFYAEMINDPEEMSDFVPGGLLGEDACCFDLEQHSEKMLKYLEVRIGEASTSAGAGTG